MLDLAKWETIFPLGQKRYQCSDVDCPADVAYITQARRLAQTNGDLGPSVPADLFVWSQTVDQSRPWLTRLGGDPWRERERPWPRDPDGIPLHFLGQICFVDSRDILPCDLPGDVALIFGRWERGWAFTDHGGVLEWSPLDLKRPWHASCDDMITTTELPFCYEGVIHRTVQYPDRKATEAPFKASGWKQGGFGMNSVQATCIGTHAGLPQGWPFMPGDGNTLIAVLSSFSFGGEWPLCDVPRSHSVVDDTGREWPGERWSAVNALSLTIGDGGATWIYRDKDGNFKLDMSFS